MHAKHQSFAKDCSQSSAACPGVKINSELHYEFRMREVYGMDPAKSE